MKSMSFSSPFVIYPHCFLPQLRRSSSKAIHPCRFYSTLHRTPFPSFQTSPLGRRCSTLYSGISFTTRTLSHAFHLRALDDATRMYSVSTRISSPLLAAMRREDKYKKVFFVRLFALPLYPTLYTQCSARRTRTRSSCTA
jgi:hypothetical protein